MPQCTHSLAGSLAPILSEHKSNSMKLKQFQGIEGEDMGVEAERSYLKHDRAYQGFDLNKKIFVFPCFVLALSLLFPFPA
jgi:hypothetical protein